MSPEPQSAVVLTDFVAVRPKYEITQEASFAWIIAGHARAEAQRCGWPRGSGEEAAFAVRIGRALTRVGCGAEAIATRGCELPDMTHVDFERMELFGGPRGLHPGPGMEARTRAFERGALRALEVLYPAGAEAPDDLLHTTCTGYASPSPAQRLVQRRGWSAQTTVTHAYHMGCYAAFPAVRLAASLLSASQAPNAWSRPKQRVDVVHTELCSLHFAPSRHDLDQLVVQTLFADGFIRYSARMQADVEGSGLRVVALLEEQIAGTEGDMTWIAADDGMRMTLSKDVPARVAGQLAGFTARLGAQAGIDVQDGTAIFAVHPGGPKILSAVADLLRLEAGQIAWSRDVLRRCGNMSSATVPHIWKAILDDDSVGDGRLVVSLAFGPGLTICGAVLRVTR